MHLMSDTTNKILTTLKMFILQYFNKHVILIDSTLGGEMMKLFANVTNILDRLRHFISSVTARINANRGCLSKITYC